MVIRRIREHVITHNWFAVAIDFLIVVAGIVIGTQVNNWNQARIERQQGSEYRERLIAELKSNEAHNQDRRKYWSRVRGHARSALIYLRDPTGDDGQFLVDAYQASQILTSQSKHFTYDELNSTGRFEEIGDAKLRGEVSGYYTALQTNGVIFDAVTPYREHLRQKMPSPAQEAIRSQCAEVYFPGPDGSPFVRLPDRCSLQLDDSVERGAAAAVRASPNILEDLNRLIADLDVKLSLLTAMDEHSRRVRALIEKAKAFEANRGLAVS
jgi:hypothetical protein